ncbi:Sec-independent protein translocase subunit TatA [Streptomyces afghaniensis]|uniref:Sec-independent protein translocase subunit TatA n=1 Tax=Streptomyces afghaniensis TaxID=66865 RepID=UPI00278970D0|nr:Sec-independent protein translocase subunit TatA [Streptomyces afghaniensis]MDQ1015417.1 sec-independent protein translocase protein TatA [Streptomyces afghaniensis]
MLRNGLEPWHLLIVAIVVIVMFGSKKLPDTARSLGRSMRILKSEAKALKEEGAAHPAAGDPAGPAAPPVSPSAPEATDGRGR